MIGNNLHVQKFTFANDSIKDAFGRLRVSNIFTAYNSKFEYSKESHLWWEVDENGSPVDEATHDVNQSAVIMPIPAVAGRKLIRQSKDWPAYQNGNSHHPLLTNRFGPVTSGVYKKFGLFSNKDGVYLEQGSDGIYYIVLRSSSSGSFTERRIPQSKWNIDTFLSTGKNPSGINETTQRLESISDTAVFSLENANILDIDLEWLAAGEVTVGLNFGRQTHFAHVFKNAGFNATTYMSTASLPITYEIGNITGINTGSMTQICQTIKNEGGDQLWGFPQVAYTPAGGFAVPADTETAVMFVRPRSLFYTKENRATIIPLSFTVITVGNSIPLIRIRHESTVTGTFNPIDDTAEHKSASEVAIGAGITSFSGGHVHKAFPMSADNKGSLASGAEFVQNLSIHRGYDHTIDADAETYGITVEPPSVGVDVHCSIDLAEIY